MNVPSGYFTQAMSQAFLGATICYACCQLNCLVQVHCPLNSVPATVASRVLRVLGGRNKMLSNCLKVEHETYRTYTKATIFVEGGRETMDSFLLLLGLVSYIYICYRSSLLLRYNWNQSADVVTLICIVRAVSTNRQLAFYDPFSLLDSKRKWIINANWRLVQTALILLWLLPLVFTCVYATYGKSDVDQTEKQNRNDDNDLRQPTNTPQKNE
jgi:hypothetical protein